MEEAEGPLITKIKPEAVCLGVAVPPTPKIKLEEDFLEEIQLILKILTLEADCSVEVEPLKIVILAADYLGEEPNKTLNNNKILEEDCSEGAPNRTQGEDYLAEVLFPILILEEDCLEVVQLLKTLILGEGFSEEELLKTSNNSKVLIKIINKCNLEHMLISLKLLNSLQN